MTLDEIVKLCDERLGQKVRCWPEGMNSSLIHEGVVEHWMIQRRLGGDPQPFVQLKDSYRPVSLYMTELIK